MAESQALQNQRRMLEDLNNTEHKKIQKLAELREVTDKFRAAKRRIVDWHSIMRLQASELTIMPDYVGQGKKDAGGKDGRERRFDIMKSFVRRGAEITDSQRANFDRFFRDWDTACVAEHKDTWPEMFLKKMKSVLDKLHHDRQALSTFIFNEERIHFKHTKALVIPASFCHPNYG